MCATHYFFPFSVVCECLEVLRAPPPQWPALGATVTLYKILSEGELLSQERNVSHIVK